MNLSDYQRIELAIRYLEAHAAEQPTLDDLAAHLGLSPFHLQRLFSRWAGVSPKRFLQYLTTEHAKQLLRNSMSVLETTFEVGLSSPGRLHDLFVSVEAVTPGEYKNQGLGLELRYAYHETPFGECLVAETERGICFLGFVSALDRSEALNDLHTRWAQASLVADSNAGRESVAKIFQPVDDEPREPVRLLLKGTNFQLKVWEALLKIPEGAVVSYGDLAAHLGKPSANRAVGTAVGQNPISYLIPCHRVLRASGGIGGYHWGTARKRAILVKEAIKRDTSFL